MLYGQIYRLLSRKLENWGTRIAKDVIWFIIIPFFVTALLATGFQKLTFDFTDQLYIPYGSDTDKYRSELKQLFPDNFVDFDPNRLLEIGSYASVIITAKDERSLLRPKIFSEILQIDQEICNITVYVDDIDWNYQDLCAKNTGKCFQNKILSISDKIADVQNETFLLKYPFEKNKNSEINTLSLGGIDVDKDGNILSAKALRLFYFLDNRSERKAITKEWEEAFIETVGKAKYSNVRIERDAFVSKEQLKKQNILVGIKYISPSSIFIFIFTIITCLSPDFLRSKPWTGIISITTTGMSVISGFGILLYIGIPVTTITIIVPFLILGIGMDDTFIMLSAWKKTDTKKSVERRMGETLTECGVSITLTSVTNIASFTTGALITSLPVHRVFCIYMSTCLVFDYIYQMTFIVAVLVLCGKAEERKLNSLLFLPLDINSESEKRSWIGRWFFSMPKEEISSNLLSLEKFWKTLAEKMINNKSMIIICYLIYLTIAIWGLTYISFRATFNMGLLYDSYQYFYFKSYESNFYQYQYRLQVFIKEEINYADPQIQRNVEEMMQLFESDPLISGSNFTESWLRSYLEFLADKRIAPLLQNFNLTDPNDFYLILRKIFFRIPLTSRFNQDVAFNQNFTKIVASRFLFQTNMTRDGNHFYHQLKNFKKTMKKSKYFVILYHFLFYYFDILDVIPATVIQTLSMIIVVVFLISVVLLPNFISIICILFTILSVGFGVIGYMSLWNVKLGIMSISMLVMVCGLSVDYAAHVSCAFISSKEVIPKKKIINAIGLTGMPIFQGSMTTILVVIIFVARPSLEFFICMKIVFLSCIISAIHGIVFMPIIIHTLDHIWKKFSFKKYFGNYNLENEKPRNFTFYNIAVNDLEIS